MTTLLSRYPDFRNPSRIQYLILNSTILSLILDLYNISVNRSNLENPVISGYLGEVSSYLYNIMYLFTTPSGSECTISQMLHF